jgi:hypothetical protein
MRHALSLTVVTAVVTTLLAVGCGTSGGSTTDAFTACKNLYIADNSASKRCSSTDAITPSINAIGLENVARACANSVNAAPGATVNASNFKACADALNGAACETYVDFAAGKRSLIPACEFSKGQLAANAACGFSSQCAGYCKLESNKQCGACAALPVEGEACEEGACQTGLVCDGKFGSRKCAKPLPTSNAGGACSKTASVGPRCKFGLVCGADDKCEKVPVLGEACDRLCSGSRCDLGSTKTCVAYRKVGEQCTLLECEPGLSCVGETGAQKCTAPVFAKPGESCSEFIGCDQGTCGADRKCKALPQEGEACAADGSACQGGLRCSDGKCQVPSAALCK